MVQKHGVVSRLQLHCLHVEEVGSNDTFDEEGGTNGDFLWQIVIYINHVVEADES